ncbi:phospholipid carrier-dependent glycosyltransferase [Micromonospora sp. CPCC 206061]|uniref:phospholipid carrier-dependent glycosyltransferase n=1 Tax=Micromonospora sp. CPCC 206061 TaxID=3122410 RepID=UPI002FEFAB95
MTATVIAPATPAAGKVDQLRRHWVFGALLLLGGVLRLLFMIAYQPAFWFYGDSGSYIRLSEAPLAPHVSRGLGFVVLLKWLEPTGTFMSVALVQHLLGLGLAVLVYAVLQRRGVARWISCLAVAPLLFDELAVTVEHYLLPDTLFTALLAIGVLLVLWHHKPGWLATAGCGILLVAAWFTKPSALPVVLLVGLYLLAMRVGWRPLVAYAVAFAVPYIAIMQWIGDRQSVYGSQTGIALYGRAAIIADCDRIKLTPEERTLCPVAHYDRADAYFWLRPQHMQRMVYTPEGVKLVTEFSIAVIRQQPLDYLRSVGKESLAHFVPGMRLGPMHECLRERWAPPEQWRDTTPVPDRCPPARARPNYADDFAPLSNAPAATPLTRALDVYGKYVRTIPLMFSAALLLTLAALFAGRRVPGRTRLATVMLLLAGPGLTVLTVLLGMYEARYALPALPLAAVGAALALHGLINKQGENVDGAPPAG